MQSTLRTLIRTALLVGTLAATHLHAASGTAEQRVQEEVQSALLRLVDSGEISPEAIATLRLDAPASRVPVFGAIVDTRFRADSDRDGLPVAAVTPGGSAEQAGLRAGDRLLAVNGQALVGLGADAEGRSKAALVLRDAVREAGDAMTFRVARGGEQIDLRGAVRVVHLPAYRLELGDAIAGATFAAGASGDGTSACGRISVFDVAPRGKQIYPAVLIAIDGHAPGPNSSEVFRVEPGRRRLTVAERIDASQFGSTQRISRDRGGRDRYKELIVDVQPGITYRLGAQFNLEQRNSIRDNAYWEPVVWTEVAEACR